MADVIHEGMTGVPPIYKCDGCGADRFIHDRVSICGDCLEKLNKQDKTIAKLQAENKKLKGEGVSSGKYICQQRSTITKFKEALKMFVNDRVKIMPNGFIRANDIYPFRYHELQALIDRVKKEKELENG